MGRAGDTGRTYGCQTNRGVKHGSAGTYGGVGGAGELLEAGGEGREGGRRVTRGLGRWWLRAKTVHMKRKSLQSRADLRCITTCIKYLF